MAETNKIIYETEVNAQGAVTDLKKIENQAVQTGGKIKTTLKEGGQGIKGLLSAITGGLSNDLLDAKEALGGFTKGFGALRGAIIATGIGALVVAVGLLVAHWGDVVNFLNRANSASLANLEIAKKNTDEAQKKLDAISAQENVLKLQGKSEREILELKAKQTDELIAGYEAQLLAQEQIKTEQIETAKRNKSILTGIIQFLTAPLQALLFTVDKVAEFIGEDTNLQAKFNDFTSGLIFDPEEVAAENEATIQETRDAISKLKNDRAGLQLSLNAIDKKGADERKAIREKELAEEDKRRAEIEAKQKAFNDERVAREAAKAQELIDLDNAIQEARLALIKDGIDKEKMLVDEKYNALFDKAKGDSERTKELMFLQNTELAAIDQKYRDEKKAADDADAVEAEKKKQERIKNDYALTAQGIEALQALTELLANKSEQSQKRAFKVQKALRIAQTLITTYQNVTAAWASQVVPGDPTSLPRGFIAAGSALALGLNQVKEIAKTKFEGGESGGSGGGGSASVPSFGGGDSSAPSFNPGIPTSIQNQPTPQPLQAYVVTMPLTSAQHAQQKIDELATL